MATRREKVILELEDNFSSGMARAAAATALLDKSLGSLSGSAVQSRRDLDRVNEPMPVMAKNSTLATGSINQLTGRLRLMAEAAAILGPALVPIGAAAVPGIAAMSVQLGLTAAAAGTAVLAFKGVGDGLKALNEYQLEPSAENFQKMQLAMEQLGPAGADFARFLDDIAPKFQQLQMTAREGMFPGIEDGINSLLTLLPQVNRIVGEISGAMGQLASEAGAGLSGSGFAQFFNYLETDARPILEQLGHTIGNFASGIADLVVAFSPLTSDFSGGLLEMSEAFSEWTDTLGDNQSFQEFLSYLQKSGPQVLDFAGSLAGALGSIVAAAAPVGSVVLPVLTKILDLVADIADSPIGTAFFTAAAGMAAYSRAASLASSATTRLAGTGTSLEKFQQFAAKGPQIGAGIGLVALSMTDLDEKAGVSNTAMLTLMGTMIAPGWGTAAGAIAGAFLDITAANDDLAAALERANRAFDSNNIDEQRRSLQGLRDEVEATAAKSDISDALGSSILPNKMLFNTAKAGFLQITGAVGNAKNELRGFQSQLNVGQNLKGLLVGPLNLTSDAFDAATQSAKDFSKAVGSAFAILDKRAALRGAADAIDSFNKDLKDAPKHLKAGTQAYRDMRASLDDIARTSLTAAQHLKGMNRVDFLDKQRDQFIDAAKKLGYTGKEARHLADDLHLVDKTKVEPKIKADSSEAKHKIDETNNWFTQLGNRVAKPKVTVDTGGAAAAIQGVANALSNLDGDHADTYIYTHRVESKEKIADGGEVLGQRLPYGDKVSALLAPGEEVISNRYGQADRYRADRAAGLIPHYADGGQVQRIPSSVTGGSMRVTFGDANFNGTLSADGFLASVHGSMRAVAQREIRDHERHQRVIDRD